MKRLFKWLVICTLGVLAALTIQIAVRYLQGKV